MSTILIFLAVLFVLVLVHEWGHYIVAKLTGMRVDEFGIGFPPKLLSFKKGETEYTLNSLPLGGFVKIYGEDPTAVGVADADRVRAFGSRPKWAQALVLLAGVTMNWIFAWFLLVVIMIVGVQTQIPEEMVSDTSAVYISGVMAGSPAENIIPPNAKLIALSTDTDNLEKILPSTISDFVANAGEKPVRVTYEDNDGQQFTVEVLPKVGLTQTSPNRAAIGVELSLVDLVKKPLSEALVDATKQTYSITVAITTGLFGLVGSAIVGTADFSQVSGPIGIVNYVGNAAAIGFTSLLFFTAIISMNLAVINLLPIPALDGGRLVFVAIEAITRKEIPPIWAARVNLGGFVCLMLLMLLATVHDVIKLF